MNTSMKACRHTCTHCHVDEAGGVASLDQLFEKHVIYSCRRRQTASALHHMVLLLPLQKLWKNHLVNHLANYQSESDNS